MQGIDWFAVTGVLLVLILAYWYADRKPHPRRSAWCAFLILVLVFAGIVCACGLDEAATDRLHGPPVPTA